jgi:Rad3-related DNA helicase
MGIINCVPEGWPPRPDQAKFWAWLEQNWDDSDVIVVGAPPAIGKSLMNVVTARWLVEKGLSVALMAPRKFLQDQYVKDFPWMPVLKGMSAYICDDCLYGGASCRSVKTLAGKLCGAQCKYLMARETARASSMALFNFHSYFVNQMYKDVAIIDEGHGAVDLLYGLFGRKLWKCEVNYPDTMEATAEDVASLLESIIENLTDRLTLLLRQRMSDDMIEALQDELESFTMLFGALKTCGKDFLIRKKTGEYLGQIKELRKTQQEYIYVKTMNIDRLAENVLWPREKVSKIIITSATVREEDIEALGLNQGRRVKYYTCDSPIPEDSRLFIIDPTARMTRKYRKESYPKIIQKIKELAVRHAGQKGIVHCTYDVARELKMQLGTSGRFMFHDNNNKDQMLADFMASRRDPVLIASGMAEGIDLKDDLARWQVITMLQYPSLEDDVMQWMAHAHPARYRWMAIRNLIQQAGRIVRSSEDWGVTYFIGAELDRDLFAKTRAMWPKWFVKAMVWP